MGDIKRRVTRLEGKMGKDKAGWDWWIQLLGKERFRELGGMDGSIDLTRLTVDELRRIASGDGSPASALLAALGLDALRAVADGRITERELAEALRAANGDIRAAGAAIEALCAG